MRTALVVFIALLMVGCGTVGKGHAKITEETWFENGEREARNRYMYKQGEFVAINAEGGENSGQFFLTTEEDGAWALEIGGTQAGLTGPKLTPELVTAIGDALAEVLQATPRAVIDGVLNRFTL